MATKTTSAGSARTTAATGAKRTAGKTAAATTPAVRTTAAAGAKRVVGKSDAATTATAATRVAKKARSAADTAAKLSGSASKAGLSALGTASDLGGLVAEASRNTLAINPLIGLNKRDVASAAGSLLKAVASTPRRASTHLGRYVKELGQVAKGKSELVPDPKDRRFADPAWKSNALYARLMQSYLATQKELSHFIDQSALNKLEKGRAHFFASLITDALAPSNWLFGNPAAVRKIVDTGGDNLVKGLKNLIHDARHNHMLPSMVDATPFKVGETIATSPGQVVLRHEMFELLQFAPTTPQVHARPLVMSPPQVNKYYAIDLTPDKSLVKWATDSGVQLFVVSWRNPTVEHRHWGLDDYVRALDAAVDATCKITGSTDVNMWGSCSGGMTLAHPDAAVRRFWIDHCKASRRISAYFGRELGTASVMNIWIPDGMKDLPVDRLAPRQRLAAALDEIISEKFDEAHHIDAVESKLFGIGAESYTVGSNEFYMGYAASRGVALCLDAGHFHPTEVISDKISAASLYVRHLLLHVSRPVRWDSDHVVLLDEETQAIANEIVRNNLLGRVHIGLDFFDASINRIAAWVIGTRNMKKALLRALLEPIESMREAEDGGDYTTRLALMEESRSLPWQAVWDYVCAREEVPVAQEWISRVKQYEAEVLVARG